VEVGGIAWQNDHGAGRVRLQPTVVELITLANVEDPSTHTSLGVVYVFSARDFSVGAGF
jgi:hypothetical protein